MDVSIVLFWLAGLVGGVAFAVAAAFAGRAADPDYEMFLNFAIAGGAIVGTTVGILTWLGAFLASKLPVARPRVASAFGAVLVALLCTAPIAITGGETYAIIIAIVAVALSAVFGALTLAPRSSDEN